MGWLRRNADRLRRGAGSRFALFHLVNSSLTFVLSFAQLFVFVRVLDPGFYGSVVLVTSISIYLAPIDNALSRVAFVQLRDEFLNQRTATTSAVIYRLYAVYALLLAGGMLTVVLVTAATGGLSWRWFDLMLYLAFCLVSNFWHFESQTLGWAIDQGMAFEKAELFRRSCNFLLLGLLFWTGQFTVYSGAMLALSLGCMVWYSRVLAAAGAGLGRIGGIGWDNLRDAVRLTGGKLGSAAAGSGADFMLMNAPYAIVTAAYGTGAPLIALDTCQKLLRAIVTALRICSEALLPKQSAALNDGDYGRLMRVLIAIATMSSLPALAICAALLFTSDALFAALLGPLAPMMPAGTGPVLVALIGAALAHNLAGSFLSYSGFFADVLRTAQIATVLMLGLAAAVAIGGIAFPTFLRGYAAVFLAAGFASCTLAWLRIRRLRGPATEPAAS